MSAFLLFRPFAGGANIWLFFGRSFHGPRVALARFAQAEGVNVVSTPETPLTLEQQFRVERACRKIDECNDVESLKQLSKALVVTAAKDRAYARVVMDRLRK